VDAVLDYHLQTERGMLLIALFHHASFWWLHLMVVVWVLFAVMIYVLEPLVIHRRFHDFAMKDKDSAFALAARLHAIALCVALVAIAAGVLGAHGGLP
jgi:hypothetical protein